MEKLTVSEGTIRFLFGALRSRYIMLMTGGEYAEMARCMGAPQDITCDLDANPSIVDPEADWYVKYTEFIGFWRRFYYIPNAKDRAEMEAIDRKMRAEVKMRTAKSGTKRTVRSSAKGTVRSSAKGSVRSGTKE